ncbi:hypothetical protein RJZ90_007785 [Blastomyces dermatitidis]
MYSNLYGSHPFYLDTRYFEVPKDDKLIPATDNEHDPSRTELWVAVLICTSIRAHLNLKWQEVFNSYRWGYKSWTQLEDVVSNFEKLKFHSKPFGYRDFEFDPNNYPIPEGQKFVSTLHQKDLHWIPMVDAASTSLTLKPPPMRTKHSREETLQIYFSETRMAAFTLARCGSGNLTLNPVHPPFQLPGERGNVIYDYPEGFNITNATEAASASSASLEQASKTGDLAVHAVSPNATSADGTLEYDIHNLFGHQLLSATYHGLLEVFPNRRPFIIGRSTFSGSGKWAGHWGGDNQSRWAYMFFSIPQGLSFSLFGIPMFGVDTYGFNGNSDEELCNR